jgi:hypothetical protein
MCPEEEKISYASCQGRICRECQCCSKAEPASHTHLADDKRSFVSTARAGLLRRGVDASSNGDPKLGRGRVR